MIESSASGWRTAILLLGRRVNEKPISDDGYLLVALAFVVVWSVASSIWALRRQARDVLPRKRQLEALVKALDGR